MKKEGPQDRSDYNEPPAVDSSSSSRMDSYEEVDETDPDDSVYTNSSDAGPQGGSGWVPQSARNYGIAGSMPPSQDRFARPHWQRSPYKEVEGMMPYEMWNAFAPEQGAAPPSAAPVGRNPRQGFKPFRKGKERSRSVRPLAAESRPDKPAADQTPSGKSSGKSKDNSTVLRLPADVDAVYNSADARDVTVHFELDLFRDVDEELEEFNRLSRMGNFAAADSFFESYLKEHMTSNPSIFVQYAEMLLEKGDLKSLLLLDGDSVFGRRGFPRHKDPEKSESQELLEMNWMLVRAVALFHSQHEMHKLRTFSLGMRLTCLAHDRTISRSLRERGLCDWADWKSIYRELLTERRIWDFRDVLIEACVSYDTEQALNAFLDHASPIDGMVADWQTDTPDESTELALLDLLCFIAFSCDQSQEGGGLAEDCLRLADPIGNTLLDSFPHTVHSRPFIQWLVSKALAKNGAEQFAYLSDYAGLAIRPKPAGVLPYYIPIRQENPGWVAQDLTPAARDVLEVALKASRDMQDYQTEELCLNQLALGTKDPGAYFQQLGHLQKKQHNMGGFLSTCLTRYLICWDDGSKKALLEDLNSFGSWKDASDLIMPTGAAARDVIQHALSRSSAKSPSPSIMSASKYSSHLPEPFKSIFRHLPRPRLSETDEQDRPSTETSSVEQHSESEEEPQESPEKSTRSRNTRNDGFRVGSKEQAKDSHKPAARGFYPGPSTNHGLPPYYPMKMIYGAQPAPPAPTEPPLPSQPPPLAAEAYRPSPQMEQMQKQLEVLQAKCRKQEEAKKQADLELQTREDAERAFKIRMEMQRVQEEANREIELAKIAAKRAARERIEEERKAEAERQRQHAEMTAKAERDARERLEKERTKDLERQSPEEIVARILRDREEVQAQRLRTEANARMMMEQERVRINNAAAQLLLNRQNQEDENRRIAQEEQDRINQAVATRIRQDEERREQLRQEAKARQENINKQIREIREADRERERKRQEEKDAEEGRIKERIEQAVRDHEGKEQHCQGLEKVLEDCQEELRRTFKEEMNRIRVMHEEHSAARRRGGGEEEAARRRERIEAERRAAGEEVERGRRRSIP